MNIKIRINGQKIILIIAEIDIIINENHHTILLFLKERVSKIGNAAMRNKKALKKDT